MQYKLGKRSPINKDSLSFEDFVTLIPNSPLVDFAPNYTYPMDKNDSIGDCVVAGFDHLRQVVTGQLCGQQKNFTDDEIIAFYKTQNPNFPAEDNGMDIQTFLEYLQANKYILGFAKIDHTNEKLMRAATYMGIAIMTGVQLQSAQEQQFPNQWNYVFGSPIIGGHCIPLVGYNSSPDIVDVVTWGKLIGATENFVMKQMDEAWFILMQEHVDHPAFRTHWNLAAFSQAVSEITSGKIKIPVPDDVFPPVTNSATLTRNTDNGKETLGTFVASKPDGSTWSCDALELPWKSNTMDISCVPSGTYLCHLSPFHAEQRYELANVPGRSGIFIHEMNYYTQSLGCIGLGINPQDINGDKQIDVTSSVKTIEAFMAFMNNESFTLTIV